MHELVFQVCGQWWKPYPWPKWVGFDTGEKVILKWPDSLDKQRSVGMSASSVGGNMPGGPENGNVGASQPFDRTISVA